MPTEVVPDEVWRLPPADAGAGFTAVSWTVGQQGELAVLLVHQRYLKPAWTGKHLVPEAPFEAELCTVTGGGVQRLPVRDIRVNPRYLALLPGGRLLLADGRAEEDERSGTWEPNAVVHAASGEPAVAFLLGDDVQALVTDRTGRIWTAYGDEGVYGHHQESQAGLAGWDARGRPVWSPGRALPAWPLEGCAAATEDAAVWLAWYSENLTTFLTRIDPATGDATSRPSPVPDPHGFAVRDDRSVLVRRTSGGAEIVHADLVGKLWKVSRRRPLRLPGGLDEEPGQGRDGVLWFRSGDTWLRVEA